MSNDDATTKDAAGIGSVDGLLAAMREARERMNQHQAGSDKWWVALYDLQKAERDYDAANTQGGLPPSGG